MSRDLQRDAEPQSAGAHERQPSQSGEQELFYELHAAELNRGHQRAGQGADEGAAADERSVDCGRGFRHNVFRVSDLIR